MSKNSDIILTLKQTYFRVRAEIVVTINDLISIYSTRKRRFFMIDRFLYYDL